jgi:hypothetical protein
MHDDIENGFHSHHLADNTACRNKNLNWAKSLETSCSVLTDSDSNNHSSSDEEDNAANDYEDEHDSTGERSLDENDCTNESLPEDGVNTATQCLICFESYLAGDKLVRHCFSKKSFHRSCIIEWLLRNDNCPYCRCPFLNLSTTSIDEH